MNEFVDAAVLARIQFAFTISFHILFPAFSIGLASYLAVLEGLWLWRRDPVFINLYRYFSKIFALTFGMGVVSGIVMSYQFGTNWGPFADATGPILGPLMGYEVMTAFFLEAGFLGVMLFGMERVGPRLHFLATVLVALGTLISAFWILSASSWMHTPAGHLVGENQFLPEDWFAIVFNPSFPYRLVHMVLAAYLTTAFIVGAVGAHHLLRNRDDREGRTMFSMAMWMALLVAPLQILAGDLHGLNTLEHQPAKVAAMEGHYETRRGAPLILFGLPDDEAEETRWAIEIPKLGSLILKHDPDAEIRGLKDFPKDERPPAALIFWTFRIMVAIGTAMVALGVAGFVLRLRGDLYDHPLFLRTTRLMGPSGLVAILAGWITTEVGRQPFVVYGFMRTSEAISPVAAPAVAWSLALFVLVYFMVFGTGTAFLLKAMASPAGPGEAAPELPQRAAGITPTPPVPALSGRTATAS
ncbi:MAG: cytochrome ubiquinol oxidase subunit I [Pseudomonadales bacterium]|jgi:cytochrome d ubiquinol oxidase subunit I|nr:cytochrome ubiquinol oxidase subunit I [Pseudomonadales bacterium]